MPAKIQVYDGRIFCNLTRLRAPVLVRTARGRGDSAYLTSLLAVLLLIGCAYEPTCTQLRQSRTSSPPGRPRIALCAAVQSS
jgi:hypothetical protein